MVASSSFYSVKNQLIICLMLESVPSVFFGLITQFRSVLHIPALSLVSFIGIFFIYGFSRFLLDCPFNNEGPYA